MKDPIATRGDEGDGGDGPFQVIDRRPQFEEAGATAAPEPRLPSFVEELKARAEDAERRTREISAAYVRLEQDREAFRERLNRDLERRVDVARAGMMRRVIEVLDDLDRAIEAARRAGETGPLAEGIALVRDRLFQVLTAEGVEAVTALGRPFDPSLAEAVATDVVDDPARDNEVLEELQRGYTVGGALLRPARVRVGRLAAPAAPVEGPADQAER